MSLRISLLEVVFQVDGCTSLKEKRTRLSGIRERFGKYKNLAVCESEYLDDHQRSQWAFVAVGSGKVVDKTLSNVEEQLEEVIDAVVIGINRQEL